MFLRALFLCLSFGLSTPAFASQRVLIVGDSLMAMHRLSDASIASYLRKHTGFTVKNRSVPGARIIHRLPISGSLGMSIHKQFNAQRDKPWDWIIVNGGGNDLLLGCGCTSVCMRKVDGLIGFDGRSGALRRLLRDAEASGAKVIYVGYLRSPEIVTPIEGCKIWGDRLERRVSRYVENDPNMHYVSLHNLVPPGDLSYFSSDRIHPSMKATNAIARRIADVMKEAN